MLYSASTNGFYRPDVHSNIPTDAVAVADEAYAALLQAQSAGAVIQPGPDGYPVAVAPAPPTAEEALAAQRAAMVCSRFQARAALHNAGLLAAAEAAVQAAGALTQIAWADAVEFRRNSPTIAALAAALGLTDQQVDDLFIAAKQITA